MMLVAAAIGAACSVAGLYLSYYLNVASGAAVVLTATVLFLVTFVAAPHRGVLARRAAARRAA
jgi:ABC-type Mn2+/Zn2+ transport system permease subunit